MKNHYVNQDEINDIDQYNKQEKYIEYHSDNENNNVIFDKDEDDLDQDYDETQASVADNNDDQYNDNGWIP